MAFFKRASKLDEEEYQRAIDKGLGKAFDNAEKDSCRASELKAVVLSDLHRGAGDGADDFAASHQAYSAALGWYLAQGYQLWLLGDVEELWENGIGEVMEEYEALLELELQFAQGPGLRRFYGNHDLDWSKRRYVDKHLAPWLDGSVPQEALRLRVEDDAGDDLGMLFLAHGHQGTATSDRWAGISRIAVRVAWRALQRWQGWRATTPADSHELRGKHDHAMYRWARRRVIDGDPGERPVLIAGHTHRPVFAGTSPPHPTAEQASDLAQRLETEPDPTRRAELRAELELVRAALRGDPYTPPAIDPPCYFNTGCCSFPDGDVTCLEINGEPLVDEALRDPGDGRGKIRLMRFLDNDAKPRPEQLAARPLREVFEQVANAAG
ncbi:MAG TPA: hypothetical protein VHF90_08860 [Thermoleophilaceae bacterium]|nr:hypothetical protein [Thermoleophilaceae bacterium]